MKKCVWSFGSATPRKFSLENSWTHPATPPALPQMCLNSTPKSFIPQEISFYLFFFLQLNKARFYLGSVTLSAILGITWRLYNNNNKKNHSFWRSHNKNRRQSRKLSAPTFKKQEKPKKIQGIALFLTI